MPKTGKRTSARAAAGRSRRARGAVDLPGRAAGTADPAARGRITVCCLDAHCGVIVCSLCVKGPSRSEKTATGEGWGEGSKRVGGLNGCQHPHDHLPPRHDPVPGPAHLLPARPARCPLHRPVGLRLHARRHRRQGHGLRPGKKRIQAMLSAGMALVESSPKRPVASCPCTTAVTAAAGTGSACIAGTGSRPRRCRGARRQRNAERRYVRFPHPLPWVTRMP
jgi:hypothetical protein